MDPRVLKSRLQQKISDSSLSVSEIERRAGLGSGSLRNFLLGRVKKPSLDAISAVARALSCELIDLVKEDFQDNIETLKLPWNHKVYAEVLFFIQQQVDKNHLSWDLDDVLTISREIYSYSIKDGGQTIDKRFAEWIINKKIGEK